MKSSLRKIFSLIGDVLFVLFYFLKREIIFLIQTGNIFDRNIKSNLLKTLEDDENLS